MSRLDLLRKVLAHEHDLAVHEAEKRQRLLVEEHQVWKAEQAHKAEEVRLEREIQNLQGSPQHKLIEWCLSKVGVHESGFNNRGTEIDQWQRAVIGQVGQPWCEIFVMVGIFHATGRMVHDAFTPDVYNWGHEHHVANGIKFESVGVGHERPGDLKLFKWPGVSLDACDHIGVCLANGKTVEGNTSPNNGGSQNNGGCVAIKERGDNLVVEVVRWSAV